MTALVSLTAVNWDGPLPLPSHYVKAERGRTAFLIVEVLRPKKAGARYAARFMCERTSATALPVGAVVHGWRWAGR